MWDMCGQCCEEYKRLPYKYIISKVNLNVPRYTIGDQHIETYFNEDQEKFCSFACMKGWFEEERVTERRID